MRGLRGSSRAQAVIEYLCAMVLGLMAVVSMLSVLPQWMEVIILQALEPAEQVMEMGTLGHTLPGIVGRIPPDDSDD